MVELKTKTDTSARKFGADFYTALIPLAGLAAVMPDR
jgi:hypothetical protein